ncbi:MAG: InlB B-repeat-containing protein [Oscillospiraceae bacterium]|nr:InlB B-repeat-containing protein [Oscillospiraceae bacterium]
MDDLQSAVNSAATGDIIVISDNITFTGTVTIPAGGAITIESDAGNNWVLTQTAAEMTTRLFVVSDNASLTLQNITLDGGGTSCGGIQVGSAVMGSGNLELNEGTIIQNGYSTGSGLASSAVNVMANNAIAIINGALIQKNKTAYCAVSSGGKLTMQAGTIRESGGLYGGVYVTGLTSVFNMNGGTITQNEASTSGGGVFVGVNATFNMNGGTITQNKASTGGGGVSVSGISSSSIATFNMAGGTISENTAYNGAGIQVGGWGVLNITGDSSIIDNTATSSGGGISASTPTGGALYSNLNIDPDTIFSGNKALTAYRPPTNAAALFPNLGFASTSIYEHPINNYDINFSPYFITYNANGGTGAYVGPSIIPGNTDTVLSDVETEISYAGHRFDTWNTQADGNGTAYAPGDVITLSADVTLYAQWIFVGEVKLSLAISADPIQAKLRELLTYTIAVTNIGMVDANNIVLTDALPQSLQNPEYLAATGTIWHPWAGSLNLGTLASGASAKILIRSTVDPNTTTSIVNTVTVTSGAAISSATIRTSIYRPNSITNSAQIEIEACDETIVIESNEETVNKLRLVVIKTAGCKITAVGHHIDYCVSVKNESGVRLYELLFKDILDPSTSYTAGSFRVNGTPATPTVAGQTITYLIPELEDDKEVVICFRVAVDS